MSWSLVVVSFLLAFPTESYMHSSSPPFVLRTLTISSSLAWSVINNERWNHRSVYSNVSWTSPINTRVNLRLVTHLPDLRSFLSPSRQMILCQTVMNCYSLFLAHRLTISPARFPRL
jgi:hypothetical protein